MTYIDAIILGFVQGITEFIPISSSGHLILTDRIIETNSNFDFDVLLNIGTLTALLIYFRHDIAKLAKQVFTQKDYRLLRNIVLSTIPAALIGFLLAGNLEEGVFRNSLIVVFMLLIGGILMLFESRLKTIKGLDGKTLNVQKSIFIGLAQALALVPGTSRSGATILAGRFSGLSHEKAAKYSFIIAIPILSGALLSTFAKEETHQYIANNTGVIVVGIVTSFIVGYLAIALMLKYLQNHSLKIFGVYRIAIAVLLLVALI